MDNLHLNQGPVAKKRRVSSSGRGYKFFGKASIHVDDEVYREATSRIFQEENSHSSVQAVLLIALERVLPLFSPGYQHT